MDQTNPMGSNFASDGVNLNTSNLYSEGDTGTNRNVSKEAQNPYINKEMGHGVVANGHLDTRLGGGAVLRNGSKVAVSNMDNARPTDLIRVGDMEVTVQTARDMGMLDPDRPFDIGKNPEKQQEPEKAPDVSSESAPIMQPVAQQTFESLSLDAGEGAATEIMNGIADALATDGAVSADVVRSMAAQAKMSPETFAKMVQPAINAQTQVVMKTLGKEGHAFLSKAYDFDPEAKKDIALMVRKTATGDATPSQWKRLLQYYQHKHSK